MLNRLVPQPLRRTGMILVFIVALVTSFFALAPAAHACDTDLLIRKIATDDSVPAASYTIEVDNPATPGVDFTVDVLANATATIEHLPPGTYNITEVGAPSGATVVPAQIVFGPLHDGVIEIVVTNPAGKLAITKVETGQTAPAATYTFDITGPADPIVATVAAGTTWTSDWLPLGTYTVTERDAPTGATLTPTNGIVTLDTDQATVTVTATNPYRDFHAKLAITKVETGQTAPAGTYTFDITGPADPIVATVAAGTTWTSDWLPLGTYTVTERDAPTGATLTPTNGIVTLDTDQATVTVTATNPYRDFHAKLAITKVETGQTAPAGTYTFDITGPADPIVATVAAGTTWTSDWLPLGTYTVTERDAPTGATLTPTNGIVTLDTDQATVTVTATNPYRDFHAKLAITKVVIDAADQGTTYTMKVTGPKNFTVEVKGGATWTSDWLPLGTYTVTEVDAPIGATVDPTAAVLTNDGLTVTVTVTNPSVASAGTLPATGGGLGYIPIVAAGLLIAGIMLAMIGRSPRNA